MQGRKLISGTCIILAMAFQKTMRRRGSSVLRRPLRRSPRRSRSSADSMPMATGCARTSARLRPGSRKPPIRAVGRTSAHLESYTPMAPAWRRMTLGLRHGLNGLRAKAMSTLNTPSASSRTMAPAPPRIIPRRPSDFGKRGPRRCGRASPSLQSFRLMALACRRTRRKPRPGTAS
jgi:hypothetical protein